MTEDQLAFRQLGISGTDCPAIMGCSPYQTIADVWLKKKHPNKVAKFSKAVQERLRWGEKYEAIIAQEYSERMNVGIYKPTPSCFRSKEPELDWVLGSPDFIIQDAKRGLEIKKVSEWQRHLWGPSGGNVIPIHVLLQCVHYQILLGFKEFDVCALIGESDFRTYRIFADKELWTMVLEKEKEFYDKYIKGDQEPDFKDAEALGEYLKAKYPKHSGRVIEVHYADTELTASILKLRAAREAVKTADKSKLEAEAPIRAHMGDAAELQWEEESLKITWKNNKDKQEIDWEAVAREALEKSTLEPEAKAQLVTKHTSMKPGPRVFRVYDKNAGKDEE